METRNAIRENFWMAFFIRTNQMDYSLQSQ